MELNKIKRQTHFVAGFSFQGKRTSNVGEDLLTAKVAGEDTELLDGVPVVFNGELQEVDVCDAGDTPDAILYSRISEDLTDFEWIQTDILRDEVKPGDPATIVLFKTGGIIRTRLADADTLTAGDEVEVGDIDTEDAYVVADTGDVVGKVIDVENEFVTILLK